jgi:hypothetical protein
MMLLQEATDAVIHNEGRKTFIEGVFLQANIVNRNGRYYSDKILERAVDEIQGKIRDGSLLGEIGHPQGASINLDRVSHIVESLRRRGNDFYGRARLVDEGAGKIAQAIIRAGGKLGVSSRGTGSLRKDKNKSIVCEDYRLITIDLCGDPSAPSAWVNAIEESIQTQELTINESAVALRILQDVGHGLADLQSRNGYDFDGRAGNQLVGHAGFPSVSDDRTYYQRLEDDRIELIRKLLILQKGDDSEMDNPGISKAEIDTYIQAVLDPLKRRSLVKELHSLENDKKRRARASSLLGRMGKSGASISPTDQTLDWIRAHAGKN